MNKRAAKAIKRKEAQAMARNAKEFYQQLVAKQKMAPFWKRQRLAISIAWGVPLRIKFLNVAKWFGRLSGAVSLQLRKGRV